MLWRLTTGRLQGIHRTIALGRWLAFVKVSKLKSPQSILAQVRTVVKSRDKQTTCRHQQPASTYQTPATLNKFWVFFQLKVWHSWRYPTTMLASRTCRVQNNVTHKRTLKWQPQAETSYWKREQLLSGPLWHLHNEVRTLTQNDKSVSRQLPDKHRPQSTCRLDTPIHSIFKVFVAKPYRLNWALGQNTSPGYV